MATRKGKRPRPRYGTSVFLNCPFDDAYRPLFRALVFTVQVCGFVARCALEADDSGETRFAKILRLVEQSQFGIHDICRTELSANRLPRFNMPYELGLFIGFKYSGNATQQRKRLLILDSEPYRYQQFLSDIAGQDIRSHGDRTETLIKEVRHWLQNQTPRSLPGADRLIESFRRFQGDLPAVLDHLHKTPEDLDNYYDLHCVICDWIEQQISP
ncbi:MAG TPA: hypothetical protein VIL46_05530 [Gemmataceae bacterium]